MSTALAYAEPETLEATPPAAAVPAPRTRRSPRAEVATIVQAITAAANDPTVDVGKMERLWTMHERIVARDAEKVFSSAMVATQASMSRVSADAVNPQTRSQYASYAQLDRHLRPIYTANGFSLSFDEGEGAPDGHVRVLCYVSHSAGHTRTYHCDIPADGKGAKGGDVMTKTHAVGSAKSYGKRYLLKDIFNIAVGEDDDDGNAASGLGQPTVADHLHKALMDRLQSTTTDAQAAALWAEGSKALADTKRRDLYTGFKDAVIAHRRALKNGNGRPW